MRSHSPPNRQLLADLQPGSITTTGKRFPSSCDAGEGPPVAKKPKADTSIDRFTEFEGNTDYDRFALYLRPLDLDVASNASAFQSAFDSQEKWGAYIHINILEHFYNGRRYPSLA